MQILIPEWMLDEDRCQGMEIVERPTLSITAATCTWCSPKEEHFRILVTVTP
jgi:hypothetical protein